MMKRIFIVTILFAVLSLGSTGCIQKEPTQNNRGRNTNDAALEYMEQKYGEKFEFVAPWGDSMTGDHELMVTCESLAGERIIVKIDDYRTENRVFHDNYVAVKYYEETVEFLRQCTNEVFGDSKVFSSVARSALSPELPADASFEEYFADEKCFISAYIAVKESDFTSEEQAVDVMEPIFSACGAEYIGILLVVVEDDEYEFLNHDKLEEKIVQGQFVHCARLTRQKDGSETLDWLKADVPLISNY